MISFDDRASCTPMVLAALKKVLPKTLASKQIDEHTLLHDELSIDSLGMMSFLLLLEKETKLPIRTATSSFSRCECAADIVTLLCRLANEQKESRAS